MESNYNVKSPVRRLMKEAAELSKTSELFFAQPIDDNLFEWHFTVRGPPDTEFGHGLFHGRISLPAEYPMKPPSIMLLTPNGRFELNKKICLSISGYHPESWQPSWSIRTALLALIGFMPTPGAGAIGSLDYTPDERKILAKKSLDWYCDTCGKRMRDVLPSETNKKELEADSREARELATQITFRDESQIEKDKSSSSLSNSSSKSENTSAEPLVTLPTSSSATVNDSTTSAVSERVSNNWNPPQPVSRTGFTTGWNPTPAPVYDDERSQDDDRRSSTASLALILLVSCMIAALVWRRIYIMTEWRFHGDEGGGPGSGHSDNSEL